MTVMRGFAGDMELIDAAAASRRYVKEIQSGELRQDSRRMQVLTERLDALSGRLEQAVYDGGALLTLLFVPLLQVTPSDWQVFQRGQECQALLLCVGWRACLAKPRIKTAIYADIPSHDGGVYL